jgi:pimeloyl-ACP methyl ester carboxylesterase
MTPWLGLIQILAIGYAIGFSALVLTTAWMLTHPPRRSYAWAVARSQPGDPSELDEPLVFKDDTIDTASTSVHVWDIAGRDPTGPVVLMTHGWGSSRQGALKRIPAVIESASRVIAWDLPGHGEAPSHARMGVDEHTIAIELIDTLSLSEKPIVMYGWSMGAGVSLALCAQIERTHDVRGVICESVYCVPQTPARAVLGLRGMPHRVNLTPALALIGLKLGIGARWGGFDRAAIASQIDSPILLIHGDCDPVSPIDDSQRIVENAKNAEICVLEGAGHNNIWTDQVYRDRATEAVHSFMTRSSAR